MRKVYLQCEICGQKMKVSRSAIGKKGACPRCGLTIRITEANTSPFPPSRWEPPLGGQAGSGNFRAQHSDHMGLPGPSEEAKQRFSMGVDLFCSGRYEEALSVFNALARLYPGNPDIESARAQCVKAMQRKPITLPGPGDSSGEAASQTSSAKPRDLNEVRAAMLDTLMEKMQQGKTEAIQLQAVELLLQLLPRMEKESQDAVARNQETGQADSPTEEVSSERASSDESQSPNGAEGASRPKAPRSHKSRETVSQHREAETAKTDAYASEQGDEGVAGYAEVLDAVATPKARPKKRA